MHQCINVLTLITIFDVYFHRQNVFICKENNSVRREGMERSSITIYEMDELTEYIYIYFLFIFEGVNSENRCGQVSQ